MTDITTKPAVPEWFADQVDAARTELADLAPRLLALVARYGALEDVFNGLVPSDPEHRAWARCGGEQLLGDLHRVADQLGEGLGRRVI